MEKKADKLDMMGVGFASLFVFAIGVALGGVGVFGFQIYSWLQYGFWESISLVDGLLLVWDSTWLWWPTSWVGVHKVLNAIPLSVALAGTGVGLMWYVVDLHDE